MKAEIIIRQIYHIFLYFEVLTLAGLIQNSEEKEKLSVEIKFFCELKKVYLILTIGSPGANVVTIFSKA